MSDQRPASRGGRMPVQQAPAAAGEAQQGVYGPGISIAHGSKMSRAEAREMEALREQNEQLAGEVQHLTALLRARQEVGSGKDVGR